MEMVTALELEMEIATSGGDGNYGGRMAIPIGSLRITGGVPIRDT
jgi:hypothetical protein